MRRKDMTLEERNNLGQFLWKSSPDGKKLGGKIIDEATSKFQICRRTVYLIWAEVTEQKKQGLPICLALQKLGSKKTKMTFDSELMKMIPFHKRGTVRGLSDASGFPKTTIGRWVLDGVIKPHTNAIKPRLTVLNKFARLHYCVAALNFNVETQKVKFKDMEAIIHMDEKWFNLTKPTMKVYMFDGEEEPYRTCQSKTHIPKVMFNCAVSRPLYSNEGELLFDGKIGIWPFTDLVPAKRNSKNRPAGTLETKPVDSVNKEVTKEMLINKVIPAIKAKWPPNATRDIIIQWDNARPHIKDDDPDLRAAASANGFNIHLAFQPPNSPDTNINDLGWFRSIQSLKTNVHPRTLDELITATVTSYENLSHQTLNKVFLSLQGCMIEIMKKRGCNNYHVTHQQKDAQIARGTLPTNLEVEIDLVKECLRYLKKAGFAYGLEGLMTDLQI